MLALIALIYELNFVLMLVALISELNLVLILVDSQRLHWW